MRFQSVLATPVNGASLAAFRIALGLVMALEAYSLFRPNVAAISTGLSPLQTYYTSAEIKFHFPYVGFEWVPLLPAQWIHVLVCLQALAGLTMALGLCYRVSAATVFLTWGYLFVVESTRSYWQSHYYLEALLTFLMIWMPAARRYSLDAWLARGKLQSQTVPSWPIALLRGQLVITYFYAGVAKLNADWLLDAVPTRWVLAQPSILAPYEPYLSASVLESIRGILQSAWFAYFINYAGAVFDLGVGFMLVARRTRLFGMVLMVLFHATNHFIIFDDIGWFPLVGVATAFIFLEPDWPERLRNRICNLWSANSEHRKGAKVRKEQAAKVARLVSTENKRAPAPGIQPAQGLQPATFVLAWLVWQSLMPIRHFLIRADSRFTYESQSFSWRLKADARRAAPAEITIKDQVLVPDSVGTTNASPTAPATRVNWEHWRGERVLYRRVSPGRIDWERLPEIFVSLEPIIGERVLYNPHSGSRSNRSETVSLDYIRSLWQGRFGHQPKAVNATGGLSGFLRAVANGLRAGGNQLEANELDRLAVQYADNHGQAKAIPDYAEVVDLLRGLHQRDKTGAMTRLLRSLSPFAMEGEPVRPSPCLVIDDPLFLEEQRRSTNAPLVIYTTDLGPDGIKMLPQVCIFDSQERPELPPYIWWNSPKDLTLSKLMHVSAQPFYLRRYARRVAELWQSEYGRRPAIHAITLMSLNGRPPQPMVDPNADLASVSVAWFRHNPWIRDLETPRIPKSAVASNPGFTSP